MYDVIIIGAGPAGLSAAIYSARAGRKTAVVDPFPGGGQAGMIADIENYPGFTSVSGYELIDKMSAQAAAAGAQTLTAAATDVDVIAKRVTLDDGTILQGKAIILATGCKAKSLGLNRESEMVGRGVSYCATCDGAFFRGKTVTVVGDGKKAEEAVDYLKNIASEVIVVGKKPMDGATHIMGRVTALSGDPLSSVTVVTDEGEREVNTSALFVCVGYVPMTHLVAGKVSSDANGYVITDEKMQTSVPGIYAVGDIRVTPLRQIVTACADGAIAGQYAAAYSGKIK